MQNTVFLKVTTLFVNFAALICKDNTIRVVGGPDTFEGRVELCDNGRWHAICGDNWNQEEATTVCRQLGVSDGEFQMRKWYQHPYRKFC